MLESGSSVPGAIDGTGGAGRDGAGAAARAEGAGAGRAEALRGPDHESMSRLMIRPPGPLPATEDRSMFWWAAMLRASGLAFTRPPSLPAGGGLPAPGRGAGDGGTGGVWAADATDAGWSAGAAFALASAAAAAGAG